MKRLFLLLIPILALSFACAFAVLAHTAHADPSRGLADTTILIIRHAEGPPRGGAWLGPAGRERADAYVKYFQSFKVDGRQLLPDTLVATQNQPGTMRERLTLLPLSGSMRLPINSRFKESQMDGLVHFLRTGVHGAVILICWHHSQIAGMIRALGGNPETLLPGGQWPDDAYGWVVVLHYGHDAQLVEQRLVHEHLMPDDH